MKYVFTLFLAFFLFACSNPAGHAVNALGDKVKKCCNALSIDKTPNLVNSELTDDDAKSPLISISILDRDTQMLTW
ncbi:MAG: hypothetical protein V4450_15625 [Bacteroidota bacterium]